MDIASSRLNLFGLGATGGLIATAGLANGGNFILRELGEVEVAALVLLDGEITMILGEMVVEEPLVLVFGLLLLMVVIGDDGLVVGEIAILLAVADAGVVVEVDDGDDAVVLLSLLMPDVSVQ